MVILLANVLIAIVTDSYKVIRDKRAAIVFWTNRLDFIAQMDAIANLPWKPRLRALLGIGKESHYYHKDHHRNKRNNNDSVETRFESVEVTFGRDLWNDIVELFEHEILAEEDSVWSLDFWLCAVLRLAAIVFVPLWILSGALVVGLPWPPQIREKLFVSAVTSNNQHGSESEKEETLRQTQIERLRGEITLLRDDLVVESSQHRTQIVQMKSAVAERRLETLNTLAAIKKNVVLALELCEIGREGDMVGS